MGVVGETLDAHLEDGGVGGLERERWRREHAVHRLRPDNRRSEEAVGVRVHQRRDVERAVGISSVSRKLVCVIFALAAGASSMKTGLPSPLVTQ